MNYKHYSVTNHTYDVRLNITVKESERSISVDTRFGNSNKITFHNTWEDAQRFAESLVSEYAVHGYTEGINRLLDS